MEFSGQHEMLNWMCLIGAMEALDKPKPVIQDYMETYILASDKCFLSLPGLRRQPASSSRESRVPRKRRTQWPPQVRPAFAGRVTIAGETGLALLRR